jgi:hydrogenase maturation protein HypF
MIGGDRCTKYPARMAASIILKALGKDKAIKIFDKISLKNDLEYKDQELKAIISQFDNANNHFPNSNIPLSSSTGRIFDTVSYLLGASNLKTYQGEPAMRLEGLASKGNPNNIYLNIGFQQHNGIYIIKTTDIILNVLDLLEEKRYKVEDVAASFQITMGNTFADVAINIAKLYDITKIGLTGGVAYNYSFSQAIKRRVVQEGFQFLEHDLVPPGDAGISIGQLIGGIFKYSKDN